MALRLARVKALSLADAGVSWSPYMKHPFPSIRVIPAPGLVLAIIPGQGHNNRRIINISNEGIYLVEMRNVTPNKDHGYKRRC